MVFGFKNKENKYCSNLEYMCSSYIDGWVDYPRYRPYSEGDYLVTVLNKEGVSEVIITSYNKSFNKFSSFDNCIIGWRTLPYPMVAKEDNLPWGVTSKKTFFNKIKRFFFKNSKLNLKHTSDDEEVYRYFEEELNIKEGDIPTELKSDWNSEEEDTNKK